MPRYNDELTIYLGWQESVQVDLEVEYFVTPARRSLDYYEPDDPAELEIERYDICRVICLSANGEEHVLPDHMVEEWMPLFDKQIWDALRERDEQLYEMCEFGNA